MNISSLLILSTFAFTPIFLSKKSDHFLSKNACKPIIVNDSLYKNGNEVSFKNISQNENELWIEIENVSLENVELVLSSVAMESYPVQVFAKLIVKQSKDESKTKNSTQKYCFDIQSLEKKFGKAVLKIQGNKETFIVGKE